MWYGGGGGWGRRQVQVRGIPSQGRKPLAWYHPLLTFLSTSPLLFSLSNPPLLLAKAYLSFSRGGENIWPSAQVKREKKIPVVRAGRERASEGWNVTITPLQVRIMYLIVLKLTYRVWEDVTRNPVNISVATFQTITRPHAMTSCKQLGW